MGEQPLLTTKAHVFQIDPATKKKWLPVSNAAINVSFYYDSSRVTYRIISVDNNQAIINSTITPNMTFTKTSQKFGQWTDTRVNTVYGLGFSSEIECTKFAEKFKEVKELAAAVSTTSNGPTNGIEPDTPETSVRNQPITPRSTMSQESASPDLTGQNMPSSQLIEQLKYENDRLKIALAQSSSNAKKWEVELQTLKNNNAKLTTALQESTANVEEWKKQLASYKEESARMKRKVLDMEKSSGSEILQRQLTETRQQVHEAEAATRLKDQEIMQLSRQIEEMTILEAEDKKRQQRIQDLEYQNRNLTSQVGDLRSQLEPLKSQNTRLRSLHDRLIDTLNDAQKLNNELGDCVN